MLAFDILLSLCNRKARSVRAYAILAMSLLAVMRGRLEREIVEPIIKREWETTDARNKSTIETAVDDINFALKWNMTL